MSLPILLVIPETAIYLERAGRLIKHCEKLNSCVTLIIVSREEQDAFVAEYPENRYHSIQASALNSAARHAAGAFIYIEWDSIPLKPDWHEALTQEYERCGKKFLLSSDSQPHDKVGGIGVYPPETQWLVPVHYPKSSWDLWLIECVPHLVARTPLIQHSYCWYGDDGFCEEEHRFPRDQVMLRPETLIFHRDPHQDLITL